MAPGFNRHQATSRSPRPCSEAGSTDPIVQRQEGDRLVQFLSTPRVIDMAQRHYNCSSSFEGMPLEDCMGGEDCKSGSGTQTSHWEKRVTLGEVMVGSTAPTESMAISNMTLAFFEDAGWYRPDYGVGPLACHLQPPPSACRDRQLSSASNGAMKDQRDPLLWGRNRGCAFVSSSCDGPAWRGTGYWCAADPSTGDAEQTEVQSAEACTVDRMAVGRCTLRQHTSPIPPPFRYFGDPSLGGRPIEDYCPVVSPFPGWDCRTLPHATTSEVAHTRQLASTHGEDRCPSCRCFSSTLLNSTGMVSSQYLGCYAHRCLAPDQLQVQVGGRWHDCKAYNQSIVLEGWSGALRCPPAREFCAASADLGWPEVWGGAQSSELLNGACTCHAPTPRFLPLRSASNAFTPACLPCRSLASSRSMDRETVAPCW
uniref:Leishmanolysin-like peptidase n=1 Tax=Haptolina brevifila TaxID=156173 RepID=A0A7S2G2H4_9EUKA